MVEKVVDKKGTRKVATAYLEFLFSPQGQEIIAKHAFRPRDEEVLQKNAGRFPPSRRSTSSRLLGGWAEVQKDAFRRRRHLRSDRGEALMADQSD